jgi:acyl-CoA synthetase (AMP-forming)/AMP-acid ligase II
MIVAENSTPLVVSLFATSAIDACAVIANPRLSTRELDTMREHATPRRILFATGVAAEVDEHARRIGATDIGRGLAMSALDALRSPTRRSRTTRRTSPRSSTRPARRGVPRA